MYLCVCMHVCLSLSIQKKVLPAPFQTLSAQCVNSYLEFYYTRR